MSWDAAVGKPAAVVFRRDVQITPRGVTAGWRGVLCILAAGAA